MMKTFGGILGIVIAGLVILVVVNAAYIIDETEQVIITQFGEPVGDPVTTPSLKLKVPFIQNESPRAGLPGLAVSGPHHTSSLARRLPNLGWAGLGTPALGGSRPGSPR